MKKKTTMDQCTFHDIIVMKRERKYLCKDLLNGKTEKPLSISSVSSWFTIVYTHVTYVCISFKRIVAATKRKSNHMVK